VHVAWSRGLVKIYASWFWVVTWIKVILPFSTLSLRKWYLTSMCFILDCRMGFLATLMELMLSHRSQTWAYSSPKSLMVYVIQRTWEQQLEATTYLVSIVDCATLDCLQEDQDTNKEPKNWQVPEVDFRFKWHSEKSRSKKPWRAKEDDTRYQRLKSGVYRKYL
jgi:hypothetical protein